MFEIVFLRKNKRFHIFHQFLNYTPENVITHMGKKKITSKETDSLPALSPLCHSHGKKGVDTGHKSQEGIEKS